MACRGGQNKKKKELVATIWKKKKKTVIEKKPAFRSTRKECRTRICQKTYRK